MYWRGKLIGLFLGLLILKNPLAGLIGFIVGHYFDKGLASAPPDSQQVFLDVVFSVMGYIAKSDGHVSEKELHIARQIMSRLQLNATQRQAAMHAFTRGKEPEFHLEATIRTLQNTFVHRPDQLTRFFMLEMQAAYAEGYISTAKQQVLHDISQLLGIVIPFMRGRAHTHHQQYQYDRYQHTAQQSAPPSVDDYAVLNISHSASEAEIKKAYRKLMGQHHPDKLASKGVSPAQLKQATEKTQQIKAAYERIRQSRKWGR
ncbi:MAG: co-chaperone DjlA [Gammaproteobacteria bacterium]